MYKACIFDLDGTLADTVESIANVANQILERFGALAQPVEDYKYHAGDGGNVLMERCMKAAGADMSAWKKVRDYTVRFLPEIHYIKLPYLTG